MISTFIHGNHINELQLSTRRYSRANCVLGSLLALICLTYPARGQSAQVKISVASVSPPRVRIEGTSVSEMKNWAFHNSYAGVINLAERIEKINFIDATGLPVKSLQVASGLYETERAASGFSYEVKLDPPAFASEAAHVSWLIPEHGVLMLGDLLPRALKSAKVQIELPVNWTLASAESPIANQHFDVAETDHAIFFIARKLRERRGRARALEYKFVVTGEWAFTDEEISDAARSILEQHEKTLGGAPRGPSMIMLTPFPGTASGHMWSAETRGRTVFLLSGRMPSKTSALAQISVPLTHELLHLWVPNALALDGEYAWFYEGFTLYQAMRVGMRLEYLTFQDYLTALGRAFDNYLASRGQPELSLVDASRQRWQGQSGFIYNKGMLVAFLYDLTLRLQSSGKYSLDDVYRELFHRQKQTKHRRDGNAAVLEALNNFAGMRSFTERYVQKAFKFNLSTEIEPFGLQVEAGGVRTRLAVMTTLNDAQRELWNKMGYNTNARRRPAAR